jgi:CRISPR-associated endonuclease/helicase Cas3
LASLDPADLLRPATFTRYFELFYAAATLDRRGIVPLLTDGASTLEFGFRTAAERFQMVDDAGTVTILVPYRRGSFLLDAVRGDVLRGAGPDRDLLRRLQRFSVSVHRGHLAALLRARAVTEVMPDVYTLDSPDRYDERLGLLVDDLPGGLPDLVV